MEPAQKRCPGCDQTKPLEEFCRDVNGKFGRAFYCKPCHNRKGKESRERNGGARRYKLIAKYGLEPSDVDRLIEGQNGVCACCQIGPAEHVDHDHETGMVRGILCVNCNSGMGMLGDNPDVLRRAIYYLGGKDVGGEKALS